MTRPMILHDSASQQVEERSCETETRLQVLREAVALGQADIDAGRYVTLKSTEEVRAYFKNLLKPETSTA